MGSETDRISEGQVSASDLHGIGADIHITALDDHTASDDRAALDDRTASNDLSDPYDSKLEFSETQIDTLETREMSHDDESVSELAGRTLPSASRFALKAATQIIEDEVTRFVPLSMQFEEHRINNCRMQSKLRRRGKWL